MKRLLATTLVTLLATEAVVLAQSQPSATISRSASFPGSNELSAHVGFQGSLGGTTPGGVKLFFEYSRRLTDIVWFNAELNPTFATGGTSTVCVDRFGRSYDCGIGFSANGDAIDALAGIKLKFPLARIALLPYVNLVGGIVGIFDRPDNGAALVVRAGGGLKYFITPRVGLGGEIDFALGGAFYSDSCGNCADHHNEFYRAVDFAVGAEFIL
jgi:hypothetical protein